MLMALYVFYGLDGPQGPAIRASTRPAHLDWIGSLSPRVRLAGPMRQTDDGPPVGSMIVLEAATLEDAQRIFAGDPYTAAGLWASADIRPFVRVVPE
jgi:hypothetical protein